MRNLLALLVLLAMTGVSTYAQEGESPTDRRSLSIYSCINSGTLNNDADGNSRLFNGNCYVYGVVYNHVFANIPWMTLHSRINFKGGQTHYYLDTDGDGLKDYAGRDSYSSEVRGRFGLGFRIAPGLSASANIDSRGVLYESLTYNYGMGKAGTLTIEQEFCGRATPYSVISTNSTTGVITSDGYKWMDMLGFNVAYSVNIVDGLSFRTRLRLQMAGSLERDDVDVADVFRIRSDNRLLYKVTPKVDLWGMVRYQANNVTHSTKDVEHLVSVWGGFTYSFDVSGL